LHRIRTCSGRSTLGLVNQKFRSERKLAGNHCVWFQHIAGLGYRIVNRDQGRRVIGSETWRQRQLSLRPHSAISVAPDFRAVLLMKAVPVGKDTRRFGAQDAAEWGALNCLMNAWCASNMETHGSSHDTNTRASSHLARADAKRPDGSGNLNGK